MKMLRNLLFWLHMITGFAAAIIIFLLSLTGVLRAYEHQMADHADPNKVVRPADPSAAPLPLDALVTAAAAFHPGAPHQIVLHRDPELPVELRYEQQDSLLINPWNGQSIPRLPNPVRAFLDPFSRIHHALGAEMRNPTGRFFTDAANLIFLYLIVSGLFIWLPKSWNAANFKFRLLFKPGLRGRLRDWNWHHVLGVWTLIPLFCISFTGVLFSYSWSTHLLFTATASQPPAPHSGPGWQPDPVLTDAGTPLAPSTPVLPLAQIVATAQAAYPGWQAINLDAPQPLDRTVYLALSQSTDNLPTQNVRLRLDRTSAQIVATHRFADYSLGTRLRLLAHPIHTGELFGLFGQTIAALVSLAAMILSWTGMALTLRRIRQALDKRSKSRKAVAVAA